MMPPLKHVLEERRGGGGLEPKSPKICVPKMAQIKILSFCKFHSSLGPHLLQRLSAVLIHPCLRFLGLSLRPSRPPLPQPPRPAARAAVSNRSEPFRQPLPTAFPTTSGTPALGALSVGYTLWAGDPGNQEARERTATAIALVHAKARPRDPPSNAVTQIKGSSKGMRCSIPFKTDRGR